jgi:hypothetical protein
VLAAVRLEDYRRYTWPANPPRILRGRMGLVSAAFISAVVVLLLAVINVGFGGLVASHHGSASPYNLIPYPELLALLVLPCLYGVGVLALAIRRFWRAGPAVPHPTCSTGSPPCSGTTWSDSRSRNASVEQLATDRRRVHVSHRRVTQPPWHRISRTPRHAESIP